MEMDNLNIPEGKRVATAHMCAASKMDKGDSAELRSMAEFHVVVESGVRLSARAVGLPQSE